MKFSILIFSIFFTSCSLFAPSIEVEIKKESEIYKLIDNDGEFYINRNSGFIKKDQFVVKRLVRGSLQKSEDNILEKSVSISKKSKLNNSVPILMPLKSQFTVWFEQKQYTTSMNFDNEKRVLELELQSPEKHWQGKRIIDFPKDKTVYCFFSQLVECVKYSTFIHRSLKEKTGSMNFYVIWDGFPYFQEQYLNIPDEVFSRGQFIFDGTNSVGQYRFTLEVAGQSIFYLFDKELNIEKVFWISQGYTLSKYQIKSDIN
ncbi:MAG: hypothetical protein H6622_04425 [Halobacteriovoraceae bacterium]|nr:hypothetical protein [Halobacteriovoraceae bacterium]